MRRRGLIIALGFAMAWPIAANGQPDAQALRGQILLTQAECIADKLSPFGAELPAVPLSGSVRAAMVKGLGNKAEALRRVAQELHGYAKLCEEGERRL